MSLEEAAKRIRVRAVIVCPPRACLLGEASGHDAVLDDAGKHRDDAMTPQGCSVVNHLRRRRAFLALIQTTGMVSVALVRKASFEISMICIVILQH